MDQSKRKWFVDTIAASTFYTITYLPVYLYLGYPDWTKAGIGVLYTATGELVIGGFLGRFIDWFRRIFKVESIPTA